MQDEYQQVPYTQPEPKKQLTAGQITLIVIAVIVAIACICPTVVIAILALIGPEVGDVFSTVIETMEAMTPVP